MLLATIATTGSAPIESVRDVSANTPVNARVTLVTLDYAPPPFAPKTFSLQVAVLQLPTQLDTEAVTGEEIAVSLQTIGAENVQVKVTQTWTMTVEPTPGDGMDAEAIRAEVDAACKLVSPGCVVTIVSRRRGLGDESGAGGDAEPTVRAAVATTASRRALSSHVTIELVRDVPANTPVNARVTLPPNVTATNTTLVTLDAQVTVTQEGGQSEAQALSANFNEQSIGASFGGLFHVNSTQFGVTIFPAAFPPLPPPLSPPAPP